MYNSMIGVMMIAWFLLGIVERVDGPGLVVLRHLHTHLLSLLELLLNLFPEPQL